MSCGTEPRLTGQPTKANQESKPISVRLRKKNSESRKRKQRETNAPREDLRPRPGAPSFAASSRRVGCTNSPRSSLALVLAVVFLVAVPEEPALSEVEWGICCCVPVAVQCFQFSFR